MDTTTEIVMKKTNNKEQSDCRSYANQGNGAIIIIYAPNMQFPVSGYSSCRSHCEWHVDTRHCQYHNSKLWVMYYLHYIRHCETAIRCIHIRALMISSFCFLVCTNNHHHNIIPKYYKKTNWRGVFVWTYEFQVMQCMNFLQQNHI